MLLYQNNLGHYKVGNLITHSKLEAIDLHSKTGIHPHWDFNEAAFSCYDWKVEPRQHILELYRARAQQLRDKYDYIVLLYSGGADSETVLQSFIDNDIKLDEIASYSNYDATSDKQNNLNCELYNVSGPRAEQLKDSYPWMKHRVIDLSQMTVDYFNNVGLDWIEDLNMFFTPNSAVRESLGLKIKEWADIIHSGKSFCLLWGHDKPRLMHNNGKYSIRFIDLLDNGPTVKSFAGQLPYADELFYWTPDMPEIIIKQGHLLKNYLDSNLTSSPFVSTHKSDLAYKEVNGVKYWINNHGVHSVIYPRWNIDTFSPGKPASIIFSPRDTWFFELNQEDNAKRVWKVGLDKVWKIIPDYWKNDVNNVATGFKACWSKDYYLE